MSTKLIVDLMDYIMEVTMFMKTLFRYIIYLDQWTFWFKNFKDTIFMNTFKRNFTPTYIWKYSENFRLSLKTDLIRKRYKLFVYIVKNTTAILYPSTTYLLSRP